MERYETLIITRSFNSAPDAEPGNPEDSRRIVVYVSTEGSGIQGATALGPHERQLIGAAITELNRLSNQADIGLSTMTDGISQLDRLSAHNESVAQDVQIDEVDQKRDDLSAVRGTPLEANNRQI